MASTPGDPVKPATPDSKLLRVEDLKLHFPVRGGVLRRQVASVRAVDGVSLTVASGETLGLVGESGCGKSTLGRAIVRLYRPTAGRVLFDGRDLSALNRRQLRHLRRDLQIIFQDPFESLDARHTVGQILTEPFLIHDLGDAAYRRRQVGQLLSRVGLGPEAADRFPHEFSGGQRQRIGIARAIALEPRLIVCDEPVSALDVSIQSQILNLMLGLQSQMGLAYLFIAHDLAVVRHISHRIAIMYAGKIVELAHRDQIYDSPVHPYTEALLSAVPVPDPPVQKSRKRIIYTGEPPDPLHPPPGCRFQSRCPLVAQRCREETPLLTQRQPGQLAACWNR